MDEVYRLFDRRCRMDTYIQNPLFPTILADRRRCPGSALPSNQALEGPVRCANTVPTGFEPLPELCTI